MKRFIGCIALLAFGILGGWLFGHGIPYPPLDRALPSYTFPNTTITIEHQVDPGYTEISKAMGGKFWKFAVTTKARVLPSSDPTKEKKEYECLQLVVVDYVNNKETAAEVISTIGPMIEDGTVIATFGLIPQTPKTGTNNFYHAEKCLLVNYQHNERKRGEKGWSASRWQNLIPNPLHKSGYSVELGENALLAPNEYRIAYAQIGEITSPDIHRRYLALRPYKFSATVPITSATSP